MFYRVDNLLFPLAMRIIECCALAYVDGEEWPMLVEINENKRKGKSPSANATL